MAVRLDRMQAGFFQVLSQNIPDVSVTWSYGQPSFEQLEKDVIRLRLSSGPSTVYRDKVGGLPLFPPEEITLVIPSAIPGAIYIVTLNDYNYSYNALPGDTVDTIRDSLVSIINDDDFDPFTASSTVNPGEFILTPDSLGSIYQAAISSNISLVDLSLEDQAVLVTQRSRQAVVEIQTYSKQPEVYRGAWSIMQKIEDIAYSRDLVDILWNRYGISIINFGVPTDISEIAGASWETRCSTDMTINLESTIVRPVDTIETVNFTLTINTPGN